MVGNFYSLFVSTLMTFLIPRIFSEETYSYFQLENLYCGYLWIASLGINDGLYIKYGGKERKEINKRFFSSILS